MLAAFGMASSAHGQDVGFLATNGSFSTISVPGSSGTSYALGINDLGQMVGYCYGCYPTSPGPVPGPTPGAGLLSLAFFVIAGVKAKARTMAGFVRHCFVRAGIANAPLSRSESAGG